MHQHLDVVEQTIAAKDIEVSLAIAQQAELESAIHRLYTDITKEILASATPRDKVERLVTVLEASRDEVQLFKAHMEQQIADLQAKLQPKTPPEVRAQRTALVTTTMNVITGRSHREPSY